MYDFLSNEKWYLHTKDVEAALRKIETLPLEIVKTIKLPHVIVYDQMEDYSTAKPVHVIVMSVWIKIEEK